MSVAIAGHPPMLRAGTWAPEVREVEQNGFPIGLLEVARYEQLEQPLDGGDRYLLYTDGRVESPRDDLTIVRAFPGDGAVVAELQQRIEELLPAV